MGKFQEHCARLYLDSELYLAWVQLQADKKLGRSFAGLLPFNEGLYQMGYINKEIYERHKIRYSKSLLQNKKKPSPERLKENLETEQLNKKLETVVDQWDLHPSVDWRNKWVAFARKNPNLSNSRKILEFSFKNRI